jgi:transcription elongation factor Elf1
MKKKTRKVINRSGKISCLICNKSTVIQDHHIRGRDILNAEHPDNIAAICGSCHDEVHTLGPDKKTGIIVIEKWVMTSSGRELIWHKNGEESFTGDDASPYLR